MGLLATALAGLPVAVGPTAQAAPVGAGFELDRGDLEFILKQIKISERHVATRSDEEPCSTLLGMGENQIPNNGPNGEVLPWGLRTVDGTCNNLLPGQEHFGAADQKFPRKVPGTFRDAESIAFDVDGPGPGAPGQATSYKQVGGDVFDSQPRIISNLIVDQTKSNPAAVAAAGLTPEEEAAAQPGVPLEIGNVAPDGGISAPFNSVFTLFGQFFDHGLDLVAKNGGTVYMPLQPDDPLYDKTPGARTNFMVLSRANVDANHEATNLTTPFVDQNQTYTSHPSHQVFLREYELEDHDGIAATPERPLPTGRLIESVNGGMATWDRVKQQAQDVLGIDLSDQDVLDVPLLATDPYGHFVPGANGLPKVVTAAGEVEGNLDAPVSTADAEKTGHAFLDDIAHHAVPFGDPDRPQGPRPPGPLTRDSDPGTTDDRDPATYDDEMLGAHFIAGDGRANENVGLISIHHIFHSEHNRLREHIDGLINAQDQAFIDEWHAVNAGSGWSYGERLFQAARFVTEMEYQHLVFEEFARKVQPMVNAFGEGGTGYETVTNAAIAAEFAHAVYRFGHSMLNERVERRTASGQDTSITLLDAFLNPPAFQQGGLTAHQAAGQVFRGMARQQGNEIDEFVTEALRNNLLGLPLDLATINIARARDTGVPTLNEARKRFYEESNNTQVMPYTSWADFGFNLKHRESLVNFVAAYGQHETITSERSVEAKRAAAQQLLDPQPVQPALTPGMTPEEEAAATAEANAETEAFAADASDFINGTGTWADRETGLNLIDLWVGGLAEKQMVAGGLLGPTFNYVFEKQLEDLQFGDRFYYLSRVQGLNLLVQLEGNSLSEIVMRNTDVEGLPSDIFSRPDFIFNLPNLGPVGGPIVNDPLTEDVDEATLATLGWQAATAGEPGPKIRFSGVEHVVFNGRDDTGDRIHSSEGDDTIRGNGGNDWMQGGDGADNLIGGAGDDIMNDLNGDDTLKGGPGNDAMSSGQGGGGDLNQGGFGKDFIIGGNDITETFAGPGDDFVFAGDDLDTVFGDNGDDWIEGGFGPFNLLQGDAGQAFQNDPHGGHDVLDGDGGEQDFDAEGGDDIMLMGPGIQRAEGMLGFDWTTHKGDPSPANSDMAITGLLPPSINDLRDRFDLVEALSGWQKDDVLRGDSRAAGDIANADPTRDHTLNAAGIARIEGLAALLPAGATSFSAGNILLGGAGSDIIEGRGGNDIIDGDKWLDVQLTADLNGNGSIGTDERFNSVRQLQNLVFAGKLDPGLIEIDRFIADPVETAPGEDVVVFSGPAENYSVTESTPGVFTVTHDGGAGIDGTDTVRNVEMIKFGAAAPVAIASVATEPVEPQPATLTVNSDTPQVGVPLTVTLTGNGAGTTTHVWETQDVVDGPWVFVDNGESFTPTEEHVGKGLRVTVTFTNRAGERETLVHVFSAPVAPAEEPGDDGTTTPGDGGTTTPGDGGTTTPGDGGTTNPGGGTTTPGDGGTTDPGGAPQRTRLVIASSTPALSARNVSRDSNVTMTLESAVQGVDARTVTLLANGKPVASSVSYEAATQQVVIDPRQDLPAGAQIRVVLDGLRTTDGVLLPRKVWRFATVDDVKPRVVKVRPVAKGSVGRNANVRLWLSEHIRGVNAKAVVLREVGGKRVAAKVRYNAKKKVVRINPKHRLDGDTRYVVVVKPRLTDTSDNRMKRTVWRFQTR